MHNKSSEKGKLKVGDVIYSTNYGRLTGKYVINRTTKTLAISDSGARFKREFNSKDNIRISGGSTWGTVNYALETPELKEMLTRQKLIAKIKSLDFKALETKQLVSIIEMFKERQA